MIELSPKKQWQTLREEDAKAFANFIVQPSTRTAITYAFAQLGHLAVTPEELNGAKKFMLVFAGMSEPDNELKPLPAKSLSQP